MSNKITNLRIAPAPAAEDTIRERVVEILETALAEARRGEITEIFMILKHPGTDQWSDRATPTQNFSSWIGKLEITKQDWITMFEREHHDE